MKRLIVIVSCIVFGLSGCMNSESADMEGKSNEKAEMMAVDEQENIAAEDREDDADSFQQIRYVVDINEPKRIDQISYISGAITIPEGDEVAILDHALYVDGKSEKWSIPLALHGDVREIKDNEEAGKHFIIVFNAPSELIDFSNEQLSLTLYVSMEVDGYRLSCMEENQKILSLPAKPRELEGLGWIEGAKIIAEYINTGDNPYQVMLVQTTVLTPLTPDDEDFDRYLSGFYGGFELWLVKKGEVVDSLDFNECFGYEKIGFIGTFPIVGEDFNDDGNLDFNIGIIDKRGSVVTFFTVRDDSLDVFTFDGSKTLLRASPHHSEDFQRGPEGELLINRSGGPFEKYFWNGIQFVLKED